MINTFRKIWSFGKSRHKYFISALIAEIARSFVGITQLCAVMTATGAVFGREQNAVIKLVFLQPFALQAALLQAILSRQAQ